MSTPNTPLSPNVQRFLAMLSTPSIMAKFNNGRNFTTGRHGLATPLGFYAFRDIEDKIFPFPVANEDRLFAYYDDMKKLLTEDPANLGESAFQLAENVKTIAEMRMAVITVHLGWHADALSMLWLDYVKARSQVEDAVTTSQLLASSHSSATVEALDSDQWHGQEFLVNDFMSRARPFMEKHSVHYKKGEEILENPAKLFSQS